jgi:hypothetical protein
LVLHWPPQKKSRPVVGGFSQFQLTKVGSLESINCLELGGGAPRSTALGIAAIQTGHAAIHHHHRGGTAFTAELRTLREV